ncbi:unnamed protein product [Soboliphyme baturini]|uniref:DDE_Tnp_ISL3 domain-containing protein n=1 Tax=Soboliphyme baturini TaxID=241478 RepID=A0A183IIE6_9BILA|nr:unnamed protein product [Soboliphyme baturini]
MVSEYARPSKEIDCQRRSAICVGNPQQIWTLFVTSEPNNSAYRMSINNYAHQIDYAGLIIISLLPDRCQEEKRGGLKTVKRSPLNLATCQLIPVTAIKDHSDYEKPAMKSLLTAFWKRGCSSTTTALKIDETTTKMKLESMCYPF